MTTITRPVTTDTNAPGSRRRISRRKPLTAVLLTAGLLLGAAGGASAATGAGSTSSIPRPLVLRVDPNLVHPDAPALQRRLPKIGPTVVKTDCLFDAGAGLFRCP